MSFFVFTVFWVRIQDKQFPSCKFGIFVNTVTKNMTPCFDDFKKLLPVGYRVPMFAVFTLI
jgi:hypothetical protein